MHIKSDHRCSVKHVKSVMLAHHCKYMLSEMTQISNIFFCSHRHEHWFPYQFQVKVNLISSENGRDGFIETNLSHDKAWGNFFSWNNAAVLIKHSVNTRICCACTGYTSYPLILLT